jgi:hypothetical protein
MPPLLGGVVLRQAEDQVDDPWDQHDGRGGQHGQAELPPVPVVRIVERW